MRVRAETADVLGRLLLAQESMRTVLQKVAEQARALIPGVAEASVTVVDGPTAFTASWTGLLAFELDETQYGLGYGPCLQAAMSSEAISITNMRAEQRWPQFTAQAVQQGALSSLSAPIPILHQAQAALNLYGISLDAFGADSVAAAREFAGLAAVAISNMHSLGTTVRTVDDLHVAMESRAVIEQAKGILMGRHGLSGDESFALLSQQSQHHNRKVRDLAAELIASVYRPPPTREESAIGPPDPPRPKPPGRSRPRRSSRS